MSTINKLRGKYLFITPPFVLIAVVGVMVVLKNFGAVYVVIEVTILV